ncbi:acyltransferase family protein [Corynebacterium aquatimens]|uniref:Peptidoglycan/LPS O-acetylase OafA/YrhL n=1 Tax=Corynebacterium aquatimens TaxID=1190508 RepID=A0A931GVJ1_9CORY|nr:acyltransferase family protein [Corynebacterium aquatimens]MBG6121291.1 peptidoglycan/LPS O-acetylase OafA/YrhL [Corynebacterium aquatimens]WJY66159.1 O-acetyltransferase OatA [Corynebacterium aquatimens]
MPKPVGHPGRYVPGLDGLRTIAVLLVVGYHMNLPGFAGGLLGVGVFFTLSGYLITANLARSYFDRGDLNLGQFWVRRFRRLMPVMVVTVVVVTILCLIFEPSAMGKRGPEALSSLFYVNNWHTIIQGDSYFNRFAGLGPLDHMWSLSIEEQFYLLWPVVLTALFFLLRRPWAVTVATTVLALVSFAWMSYLVEPGMDQTRVYEGTDTRAGGLLLGAALAIWFGYRRSRGKPVVAPEWAAGLLGACGLIVILTMAVRVERNDLFLYHSGFLILSLATVLVIVAVSNQRSIWAAALGCLPMRWIGERSYGIYLWHLPFIYFLPTAWITNHRWWSALFVTLASTALAAVSWTLFEDPIRRNGFFAHMRKALPAKERFAPLTTGAIIALLGLVSIGAAPLVGGHTAPANQKGQAMELPEGTGGGRVTRDQPKDTADTAGSTSQWGKQPADTLMMCEEVVHVGDSTSLGMFNPELLPAGAPVASDRYLDKGAGAVQTSVFGARATNLGFSTPDGQVYPSAIESATELKNRGVPEDTCWVIATGVNDAANVDAAGGGPDMIADMEKNIRKMLDILDGDRVMWPTAATGTPSDMYYANENMKVFNDTLRRVAKDYPNLVIFDWASEARAHLDWYLEGDEVHYNAIGNDQRGIRFAAALAKAFPRGVDESTRPRGAVVSSGVN